MYVCMYVCGINSTRTGAGLAELAAALRTVVHSIQQ